MQDDRIRAILGGLASRVGRRCDARLSAFWPVLRFASPPPAISRGEGGERMMGRNAGGRVSLRRPAWSRADFGRLAQGPNPFLLDSSPNGSSSRAAESRTPYEPCYIIDVDQSCAI